MVQGVHVNGNGRAAARRSLVIGACVAWLLAPAQPAAGNPIIVEWSGIAQQLTVVPAYAPVAQARLMAIVHVAMHDAVNAITREFHTYAPAGAVPAGATPEAAAIAAAYGALTGAVGPSAFLDDRYAASRMAHGISAADPGLAFGQSVAARIVQLRADDGASTAAFPYIPPNAGRPGVWMPLSSAASAQALLPGWGQVTPWVLRFGSQFRPEAPPALTSERYAKDYMEVQQIGSAGSSLRSGEQTQIALFWRASPTALWNPILGRAIAERGMNISNAARAAALVYLATADASVACWDAKYFYNYWRPQPAIVAGDSDGNSLTLGVPTWSPLVPTPAHPEYPSGHTANSGAMAAVLATIFGNAPGFPIDATSPQNPGFVRQWYTFSEGVDEVIDARVYSGIHFRTADVVGARLGRQVAQFVMTHALRPVRPRAGQ